jgi:hypothetical protein
MFSLEYGCSGSGLGHVDLHFSNAICISPECPPTAVDVVWQMCILNLFFNALHMLEYACIL